MEVVIPLEAKTGRTKVDDEVLALNKTLIEITQANQKAASHGLAAVLGVGIALSVLGALKWYSKIQRRDDKLAELQIEKLEAELLKLRAEAAASSISIGTGGESASEDG